jgi:hypothetical protein
MCWLRTAQGLIIVKVRFCAISCELTVLKICTKVEIITNSVDNDFVCNIPADPPSTIGSHRERIGGSYE